MFEKVVTAVVLMGPRDIDQNNGNLIAINRRRAAARAPSSAGNNLGAPVTFVSSPSAVAVAVILTLFRQFFPLKSQESYAASFATEQAGDALVV